MNVTFIADTSYDVKAIYNLVKDVYHVECILLLNKRNTKNPKKPLPVILSVKLVSLCTKMTYFLTITESVRNKAAFTRNIKAVAVPVIINARTTARKLVAAQIYVTLPDDYRLSIDCDCIS